MGTRSLTIIKSNTGDEICVIYRQFDGYPQGHGMDLYTILQGRKITNGAFAGKTSNGMHCLAATVVKELKGDRSGEVYLYPPGTRGMDEEFVYEISMVGRDIWITCIEKEGDCVIFSNLADEFGNFVAQITAPGSDQTDFEKGSEA